MGTVDTFHSYDRPSNGIGYVTFTGPDGIRDNRAHLVDDDHVVGIGDASSEHSSDVAYIFRAAPGTPMDVPRCLRPGEIGWGIPWLTDYDNARTGQQIMIGSFRQIAEDRTTHENMGAWYPGPEEETAAGSDGYYRENIFSGRPGTSNPRYVRPPNPTKRSPSPTMSTSPMRRSQGQRPARSQ